MKYTITFFFFKNLIFSWNWSSKYGNVYAPLVLKYKSDKYESFLIIGDFNFFAKHSCWRIVWQMQNWKIVSSSLKRVLILVMTIPSKKQGKHVLLFWDEVNSYNLTSTENIYQNQGGWYFLTLHPIYRASISPFPDIYKG